jgi:acyl-coenzyme A thioesterase PaaI-like protein
MEWTPRRLRRALNLWGPNVGAGIRVSFIDEEWRTVRVQMRLRWYNRNPRGTHFGGGLYAMVDPHLMLMLMKLLGPEYIVWDKAAAIEFVSPGRGTVHSVIRITDEQLLAIKSHTAKHQKFLPEFELSVVDENEALVARIRKVLYVRRKTKRTDC